MIKFIQYKDKYNMQVCNLIRNIMLDELKIENNKLQEITKDLEDINKNYISNEGNFWIALDSQTDEVVGTVGIMNLGNLNAEFKRFYVRKDYRNKSIGYKLYSIAEAYAKSKKFNYLYLSSGKDLKRAHRIYKNNGWTNINKRNMEVKIFVRKEAKLFRKNLIE